VRAGGGHGRSLRSAARQGRSGSRGRDPGDVDPLPEAVQVPSGGSRVAILLPRIAAAARSDQGPPAWGFSGPAGTWCGGLGVSRDEASSIFHDSSSNDPVTLRTERYMPRRRVGKLVIAPWKMVTPLTASSVRSSRTEMRRLIAQSLPTRVALPVIAGLARREKGQRFRNYFLRLSSDHHPCAPGPNPLDWSESCRYRPW
jgi:hypothetical protein